MSFILDRLPIFDNTLLTIAFDMVTISFLCTGLFAIMLNRQVDDIKECLYSETTQIKKGIFNLQEQKTLSEIEIMEDAMAINSDFADVNIRNEVWVITNNLNTITPKLTEAIAKNIVKNVAYYYITSVEHKHIIDGFFNRLRARVLEIGGAQSYDKCLGVYYDNSVLEFMPYYSDIVVYSSPSRPPAHDVGFYCFQNDSINNEYFYTPMDARLLSDIRANIADKRKMLCYFDIIRSRSEEDIIATCYNNCPEKNRKQNSCKECAKKSNECKYFYRKPERTL
ncbi:MAG: hypothetical protein LBC12_07740 [Nitrososphaerota archaeon]|nr:hypothetical protein [Nitrososphaerota archaeon]